MEDSVLTNLTSKVGSLSEDDQKQQQYILEKVIEKFELDESFDNDLIEKRHELMMSRLRDNFIDDKKIIMLIEETN